MAISHLQTKELFKIEEAVRDRIQDWIKVRPKQITLLVDCLKKQQKKGKIIITFTEEVKDGREPKFDTNAFLVFQTYGFHHDDVVIRFKSVSYIGSEKQESDSSSVYINYNYSVEVDFYYV